jgi:hypothetical protein
LVAARPSPTTVLLQPRKSKRRRNGLCVDHCGSLAIEVRLAEARAGGTVGVAA